ncbi:MAG: Uncharacterized protein FD121_363 [Gallionellaceae bacterium]|nr:MAG: Uncharacterized protein FD121_363 [Gallionellaceae bacterium]
MPSIRRLPVAGEIIEPKIESACLDETYRVLDVHEDTNRIVLIPVTPRSSKKRLYFVGPSVGALSQVMTELDKHWLAINVKGVAPRADAEATNEDLDKKYLRRGQEVSNPRKDREAREALIGHLIKDSEGNKLDLEEYKLLFDPQVRSERISELANKMGSSKRTIIRTKRMLNELLNQYWSGGSVPGALTPFSGAKGGRGKARIQKKKLGRQNAPTAAHHVGLEGFVMGEQDKDICGFCWRNYYIRGTTCAKALRRMWREFYSEAVTGKDGKIQRILLPIHQRPTRSQFERWGNERSPGHDSWKKQLTKFNLGRIDRVLLGYSSDNVVVVGQQGHTDSTSPDIEFVRVENRLDRIGPAHRILVVEGMYGYISGFYLGLDAPSTVTVLLAFLHSLTDKTEWLKWLGLDDIDPADWIQIRYSSVIADNTDARCQGVIEALDQIGTGLKFVGVARSDLNAPAETSHHSLHRMVDHNLYGTSHGQRHERGEERADILARMTIIEAIRETARAIHTYNTMALDIRPTMEMRREIIDKGLTLNRLNLTRMKINQGKLAMSLIGNDEARIKLMPHVRGVFTQHGVKLLRPDTGQKREFIEPIQYISKHSLMLERFMKAKVGRAGVSAESFDDDFRQDPYNPTELYYRNPIDGDLIRLWMKTKDEDLPFECSIPDIINLMKSDAIHLFNARNSKEEALSHMEEGQEATKQEASDAYDDALETVEKPPSKSAIRRNKKANREQEKSTYQYGMPIQSPPFVEEQNTEGIEKGIQAEQPAQNDASKETKQAPEFVDEKTIHKGDDKPANENCPPVPISILQQAILSRRQEGNKRGH